MPGFGFGGALNSRRPKRGKQNSPLLYHSMGALSRNQSGAGIDTTATAIVSGDPSDHWTVSGGRLYPSAAGDTADLNAGPYTLEMDNGDTLDITIEDCWISGEIADPNGDYSTSSNYPNLNLDLVNTTGSINGTIGNITVKDNLVEWGASLVNIRVDKAGHESVVTGNHCRYFYDDAIAVAMVAGGVGLPTTISDNFVHDSVGKTTDSAAPHVDAIRLIANAGATADWSGITMQRNIVLKGTSRGDMQAFLLDDLKTGATDSGFFFTGEISNNIIACDAAQGIWVGQAKNFTIDNNTVIGFDEAAVSTPSILVGTGTANATNGGGNTISDNIADSYSIDGGDTASNNYTAGLNGATIGYATLFDGPDFDPATAAEAKAFLNPKVAAGAVPFISNLSLADQMSSLRTNSLGSIR